MDLTSTRCCFLIDFTAFWASITAGSTLSRSFITSAFLTEISLVCFSTSCEEITVKKAEVMKDLERV